MIATQHTYERRKEEMRLFLENVKALEEDNKNPTDFYNILHSNAILMLYNLVESTVVGGIVEIYDTVKEHGLSYTDLNAKIRDIWFAYKFNQVYDKNSHHTSYLNKAHEIIDNILGGGVIELDRKAVKGGGNLDADSIRNICDNHGITFIAPKESRGGCKITEVRNLRNSLAHGLKSFGECGRDFTYSELSTMTKEIILFLDGLIGGMTEYYKNGSWRADEKIS